MLQSADMFGFPCVEYIETIEERGKLVLAKDSEVLKKSLKKTRGRDKEIATTQTKGTRPRQVLADRAPKADLIARQRSIAIAEIEKEEVIMNTPCKGECNRQRTGVSSHCQRR